MKNEPDSSFFQKEEDKTMTEKQIEEKIRKTNPDLPSGHIEKLAQEFYVNANPAFRKALQAWLDDKEIPYESSDKYSVSNLMAIRGDKDPVFALQLYGIYKNDPEKAERLIWMPRRDYFQS